MSSVIADLISKSCDGRGSEIKKIVKNFISSLRYGYKRSRTAYAQSFRFNFFLKGETSDKESRRESSPSDANADTFEDPRSGSGKRKRANIVYVLESGPASRNHRLSSFHNKPKHKYILERYFHFNLYSKKFKVVTNNTANNTFHCTASATESAAIY